MHFSRIPTLLLLLSLLAVSSCTVFTEPSTYAQSESAKIPLDPIIGNTGQPLSEVARKADVKAYAIDLEIFPASQSIAGSGAATFLILEATQQLELKLDSRFNISRVEVESEAASYTRKGGVITIDLPTSAAVGQLVTTKVVYKGQPHVALRAPWDGGFVWGKTPDKQDWIATAVQGEGCDLFWPCKDHFIDKADSTSIHLTVPNPLSAITNGVLKKTVALEENRTRFEWLLSVPASDYNIALNIGPYAHIKQDYTSVNGQKFAIEFWPLVENENKARTLIEDDLLHQIAFFEKHLGPYPWGTEKLGFVETPHLGMEHQTINAYGKKYRRDRHGFDWLLHHELAHEWFGNLMTHQRLNDAWLHEGFGFYMQPAYSLYRFGEAAYQHRMYDSYLRLKNCYPTVREDIVSSDEAFNSDIYEKGGWTLHTLRWLIGEANFWSATRELLYGQADNTHQLGFPLQSRYRTTQDFIDIVNKQTKTDYTWLFDVYLKQAALPELVVERNADKLTLTWKSPQGLPFNMPIPISIEGELTTVSFTNNKAILAANETSRVVIDPQMKVLRKLPIIGTCEEREAEKPAQ